MRDALIGFAAGALIGAAAGAMAYEECNPEEYCFLPGSRSGDAAFGALVLCAGGALIGGVIGAFDRADRWVPVRSVIRAQIRPAASGGLVIALSNAF